MRRPLPLLTSVLRLVVRAGPMPPYGNQGPLLEVFRGVPSARAVTPCCTIISDCESAAGHSRRSLRVRATSGYPPKPAMNADNRRLRRPRGSFATKLRHGRLNKRSVPSCRR